jgi:hypothetical protein
LCGVVFIVGLLNRTVLVSIIYKHRLLLLLLALSLRHGFVLAGALDFKLHSRKRWRIADVAQLIALFAFTPAATRQIAMHCLLYDAVHVEPAINAVGLVAYRPSPKALVGCCAGNGLDER